MVDVLSDVEFFPKEKLSTLERGMPFAITQPECSGSFTEPKHHEFIWAVSSWVCCKCLLKCRRPVALSESRAVCKGRSALADIIGNPRGHVLYTVGVTEHRRMIYCGKCFKFAETLPRDLRFSCGMVPSAFGVIAKTRINKLLHPVTRQHFLHRQFVLDDPGPFHLSLFLSLFPSVVCFVLF